MILIKKGLKLFRSIKNSQISFFLFIIISFIFCYEILSHLHCWGGRDWDQFTFWNAVPRITLLKYYQFPLWNPYANGGNVLLAHPHSSFLSPLYTFVLLFGPVTGIKIEIIIYLIIGMWGMKLLSKYFQIDGTASYLPPFLYMLSSIYALHVTEGHMSWLPFALVPWLFLSYLKSINSRKHIFSGVFSLSLILLAGSVDVFHIAVLLIFLYAIVKALQTRRMLFISRLLLIFLGTFLVCSIKLIPMIEFLFYNYRLCNEQEGISLAVFLRMLLSPAQAVFDNLSLEYGKEVLGLPKRWHEFGAYIGPLPLLLSLLGIISCFRKRWPLVIVSSVSLLITLGDKSPLNIWKVIHSFPIFNALSTPSRYILGVVFCFSLFAGMGLVYIRELTKKITSFARFFLSRALVLSVILFILSDLYMINSFIFKNICWIKPLKIEEKAHFAQRYKYANFFDNKNSHSSMYPILLSNSGLLHAYEVMHVHKGKVLTTSSPDYKGEVYLCEGKGDVAIVNFTPNRVTIDVRIIEKSILVLNQNYYRGWHVKGIAGGCVMPFNGLISTSVEPGFHRVAFYYFPISFLIGLLITCITCGSILVYVIKKRLTLSDA